MRICYISHSISHFTRPYVDYFSRLGHEVHLVSLLGGDAPNAINHHPGGRDIAYGLRRLAYLRALPRIRSIARSLAPCVVHAHYLSSNGFLAAFADCHPLVVSARGSDLHLARTSVRRAVLRYVLRRADLVNPVSRSFEKDLIALGAVPGKIVTLTQGVDTRRLAVDRSSRPPGPARLLCTRALHARYNAVRIVEALSVLRERGVPFQFTFAAGGPLETDLRRLAAGRCLADRVRFLGGYTQDELPAILQQADVYVSASMFDGTSVSLLEAMASGALPVVADIEGNREWLTGDGDGLLFEPTDPVRLADCLQIAIDDTEFRAQAAVTNRLTVERRGERDRNLGLLEEIYRRLLDGRVG